MRTIVVIALLATACAHGRTKAPPERFGAGNPFVGTLAPSDPCYQVNLAMADEAAVDTTTAAIAGDETRWQLEVKELEGRGRLGKCMAARAIQRIGDAKGKGRVQGWIDSHP